MKTPPDIIWYCAECEKEDGDAFNAICCSNICPRHKIEMQEVYVNIDEYLTITRISKDIDFIKAMIKLKEENPIEYQLKMSQFKNQAERQKVIKESAKDNVKCPKCGSTNIQVVPRKWSLLTGFLTNKTDRVCVNCKYKF